MKEENLKKLNQLDRIEYLLKKHSIGNMPIYPNTLYFITALIVMLGFVIIGDLILMTTGNPPMFIHVFHEMTPLIAGSIIFLLLVDLFLLFMWIRMRNKLDKEFFEIKSKKSK
jgi:hypothetical protein